MNTFLLIKKKKFFCLFKIRRSLLWVEFPLTLTVKTSLFFVESVLKRNLEKKYCEYRKSIFFSNMFFFVRSANARNILVFKRDVVMSHDNCLLKFPAQCFWLKLTRTLEIPTIAYKFDRLVMMVYWSSRNHPLADCGVCMCEQK